MSWPFAPLRYASSRMFRPAGRSLTLSSVEGPLNPPLSTSTLSEYFSQEILDKQHTRPALICRNELPRAHGGPPSRNLGVKTHLAWDFEEFDRHIKAVARGLLAMGVKKGDRVGVLMGNNRYYRCLCAGLNVTIAYSAYASLQWACASIGNLCITLSCYIPA